LSGYEITGDLDHLEVFEGKVIIAKKSLNVLGRAVVLV
jgi:hypothetical protein